MYRTSARALIVLALLSIPVLLLGKGQMLKITINSGDLHSAVESSEAIIGKFHVWSGPGVFVNGVEETEGFIIDWSKGTVPAPPAGLQRYKVYFYSDFRKKEGSIVYSVLYAFDPALEQGFVYLPGKGDEMFRLNVAIWRGHGFEGNWLMATPEWERFARPLIAKARAAGTASLDSLR